jgi:hypothetical protein
MLAAFLAAPAAAIAQTEEVERFTATTANMSPAGETLRIDVLRWSTETERSKAVSALGSGQNSEPDASPAAEAPPSPDAEPAAEAPVSPDAEAPASPDAEPAAEAPASPAAEPAAGSGAGDAAALREALDALPTVGYVWPSGSSLGFSIKYAERVTRPDGGERIILVTSRRLGAYDLEPWTATDGAREVTEPFSVILLRLNADGEGDGTMSLVAEPTVDADAGTISLTGGGTVPALLTAKRGR